MKKKLIIKDKNKTIYYKNRKVRTPVIIEVTDQELRNIKPVLKIADIRDIEIINPNKQAKDDGVVEIPEAKEVVIEELEDVVSCEEPKTILEKLMKGDIE